MLRSLFFSKVKIVFCAYFFWLSIFSNSAKAQVSAYTLTALTGVYNPLLSGVDVDAIEGDDVLSASIPIGFTFNFDGVNYTEVKASSNGFLTFNTASTANLATNNLATGTGRPLLAPLWDDLDGRATGGSAAKYFLEGTAPNRIFTFEWLNWEWNWNSTNPVISFQVKLFESSNVVEFHYRQETGAVNAGSASIGIAGVANGVGNFLSLNNTSASPLASSTSETTNLNSKPATNQIYTFMPPLCSAPSNLNALNINSNSADLSWVSSVGLYDVDFALSSVPLNSGALSTGLTDDSLNVSGLQPNTEYRFYVRSDCGGGVTSNWSGPFIFRTPLIPVSSFPFFENWESFNGAWVISNGSQINKWVQGGATNNGGSNAMYVSNDNGVSHIYTTNTASVVHFYKDFTFPVGSPVINLSFDWIGQGEGTAFDRMRVFVVPTNFVPTAGTQITTSGAAPLGRVQIGQTNFNLQGSYTTVNLTLPAAYEGQTARLIFEWRNDGSGGTQPPAAVDNINISASNCLPPTALFAENITTTSADLKWTSTENLFDVEYGIAPLSLGGGTFFSGIDSNSLSISGLDPATVYQFTVKADCGTSLSTYASFGTFTTGLDNNNSICLPANSFPIPDNGCASSNFLEIPIEVSGESGTELGVDIILTQVDLVIAHTWNSDLTIELESPSGQRFILVNSRFGNGDNFGNPTTCPSNLFSLVDGGNPLTNTNTNNVSGQFQPEQNLSSFKDSTNPNGIWILRVCDAVGGDVGDIRYVQLSFDDPCANFVGSVSPDLSICFGDSATLTATGGNAFIWSTGDSISSIIVFPLADQIFQVDILDTNFGCVSTNFIEVTVVPLPVANAGNDTTICEGESVLLSASGGNSYLWNTGETTQSISVSPALDSTFTVVAFENSNNCSASDQVTVFINPSPVVSAGNDTIICLGASVNLTATGTGDFEWSTTETSASITVFPNVATTYSVTLTDGLGCTATDGVFVDVNTLSGLVPPTVEICLGETETITATGGDTYLWSNGDSTASTTISPIVDETLTVTITVSGSCTVVETVEVTVLSLPVADAGSNQTICPGTSVLLNGLGGINFSWSNGETTSSINVSPLTNETFTLTVSDNNGCTASDDVVITLYASPPVDAGQDVEICSGGSVVLIATGGNTFLWSTSETTSSISVSPLVDETFTVTVTDSIGCTATDEVTVSIEQSLTPNLTPQSLSVCNDQVLNFTSTVGQVFVGANATSNPIPDNSLVGLSSVINLNASGNITPSSVIQVTLNITHTWDSDLDVYLVGPGNCGTLELTTDNGGAGDNYINSILSTSATNLITTGTAPFTGNFLPEATITTPPILNSGAGGGTYTIPAVAINGCPVNGNWTLFLFDDAGGDTGNLNSWNLQISEPTPPFATHILNGNGTISSSTSNNNSVLTSTVSNMPPGAQEYIVELTSLNGCITSDTSFVSVFARPEIIAVNSVCATNNDGEINVSATLDNGSFSGSNIGVIEYSFDGGVTFGTDSFITGLSPGTFQVVVRNSANPSCTASPINVEISAPPTLTVINTAPVCEGQDINLSSQASGGIVTQSFSGSNTTLTSIPDGSLIGAASVTQISGTGVISANSVISVSLNITHTFVGDVDIYLEGPNGCGTLELSTDNGGGGDNYTGTIFSTNATNLITGGTPPFTNTFLPEGNIGIAPNLNSGTGGGTYTISSSPIDGCPINGNWTLWIFDDATLDAGSLQDWSLEVTSPGNYTYSFTGAGVLGTPSFSGTSNSQASVSIFDAPIGENEFIITVEDINGCASATSSFANVFDVPNNIIITTVCADVNGGSISVVADPINNANFSGADIGVWEYSFNGGTTWTTDDVASGLVAGTYSVLVRNSAHPACQSSVNTVEIFEVPTVAVNDPGLCVGANVDLVATSPNTVSYLWSNAATTATINVNTIGDFIITVTDANGCFASDTATVTTSSSLTVMLDDEVFCSGDSAVLNASNPGATYLWSPNGETTQTITVSIADTYSVIVASNGCSGTDSSTVVVNPNPVFNLANTSICAGEIFTLDAGNFGSNYLWSPNGETTQTIDVSDADTYQVTITNSFGCIIIDSAILTVNALPVINLKDTLACQNDVITLDAENTGSTYEWLPNGETSQQINITLSDTYSVTVTDANNCTASDTAVIGFNPAPGANAGNDQTICEGESAILIGAGNGNFEWSEGSTTISISVAPVLTSVFVLTITDPVTSCISIDSAIVNVNANPVVAITGDTAICSNLGTTLTASGGLSFEWSNGDTSNIITVFPQNNETFSVTITDANFCSATASIDLAVTAGPNADAGSDVGICEGNTITIFGNGGTDFLWSTGATTANLTVMPMSTTTYTLTVSDNSGCDDVDSVTVFVNPLPLVSLTINEVTFCDVDGPIALNASPTGGQFNGTGIVGSNFEPATAGAGSYLLTYTFTDANQCTNMADVAVAVQICVGVEDLKNAFTSAKVFPNPFNNQINIALNAIDADEIELKLFDVLGKEVASSLKQIIPGENLLSMDGTKTLSGGVYYLKIVKADLAISFRVIKMD